MVEGAHCHCDFGRWYLSPASRELGHLPGLIEMEVAHREMHGATSVMVFADPRDRPALGEAEHDAGKKRVTRLGALIRMVQSEAWSLISTKDPLTGLFNRRAMDTFIAGRRDAPAGSVVTICDIDHFKRAHHLRLAGGRRGAAPGRGLFREQVRRT